MFRSLFKTLLAIIFIVLLGLCAIAFLAMEDRPSVEDAGAPTPSDVAAAKSLVASIRNAGKTGENVEVLAADLNRIMALGKRFLPGMRGHIETRGSGAIMAGSLPVPMTDGSKWWNLRAEIPAFEGQVALNNLSLGGIPLPSGPSLWIARHGANVVLGNRIGDTVLDAANRFEAKGEVLIFTLTLGDIGNNGVLRGVFGSLRGGEMPTSKEIDGYEIKIRQAMEAGTLPSDGSFLPYVQFSLDLAFQGAENSGKDDALENAFTAAVFALTRICGARDFTLVVGGLSDRARSDDKDWTKSCQKLTLNDRTDSRKHFITAAALQAASNRGFSTSVGEFKELHDTLKAGGFDFTDIAANNSGIRLSDRMMNASLADWPLFLSNISSERDIVVDFQGIPSIMKEAEFLETYGEVGSDAYNKVLVGIETRIDGLRLHQ